MTAASCDWKHAQDKRALSDQERNSSRCGGSFCADASRRSRAALQSCDQSDATDPRISVETAATCSADESGETKPPLGTRGRAAEAPLCMSSELIAAVAGESILRLLGSHSPHQSSSRT